MTPSTILISFLAYTAIIFTVSWITGRKSDNESFFIGNRQSPWYVVAYGMIGASLSGVTFISVPGDVGNTKFAYMVIVLGYLLGYFTIARILLPLYYRLNLTSIYTYLDTRFGRSTYKTGALFFLLSRTIGASFRMYLVVNVLQLFVFDAWNIHFTWTVAFFMILILLYTYKGGIRTIVWTDTLQTTFMLGAIILSVIFIGDQLNLTIPDLIDKVTDSKYSKMFFTQWEHPQFFLKQFFSGAFIAIVMTGLDQDMMQKNLSCRNLKESQKNMYWMSASLVPVNLIYLTLGAVLFIYAETYQIAYPNTTDDLFPIIALKHLRPLAGIVFLIGLISAAYSSADSAMTSLTTSFSVDFLGVKRNPTLTEKQRTRTRHIVHIGVAIVVFLVIIFFRAISDASVISTLFTIAGYTYGPLLGFYSFGLFTKFKVKDKFIPVVAVASPLVCYFLSRYSEVLLNGYTFGFELLIVNGIFTFLGLYLLRKNQAM